MLNQEWFFLEEYAAQHRAKLEREAGFERVARIFVGRPFQKIRIKLGTRLVRAGYRLMGVKVGSNTKGIGLRSWL